MTPEATKIAIRIRKILGDDPNVSERNMFGGVCFMLNGNMLCGPTKEGHLMLRVGKERHEEALGKASCAQNGFYRAAHGRVCLCRTRRYKN